MRCCRHMQRSVPKLRNLVLPDAANEFNSDTKENMPNTLNLTPQVICTVLQKPKPELNQIEQALANAIKGGRSDAEVSAILDDAALRCELGEAVNLPIAIPLWL